MPKASRLLRRAYDLVHANRIDDAALVLDAVVQEDPRSVEAWELYLQISPTIEELRWLGERIRSTRELDPEDKDSILVYQQYLLGRLETGSRIRITSPNWNEWVPATLILTLVLVVAFLLQDKPSFAAGLIAVLFVGWLLYYSSKTNRSVASRRGFGERRFAGDIKSLRLKKRRKIELDPDRPILVMNEPIIEIGPEHRSVIKTRSITESPPATRKKTRLRFLP
jgi:hypothetical protein